MRRLALPLLALLTLAVGAARAQAPAFTMPEIGMQTSGACRQLAVRDRTNRGMVGLGCFGGGKYAATPNTIRSVEGLSAPPTASYGGWTYQSNATSAADILGPQQPPGWFTVDGVRSVIDVPPGPQTGRPQTTSSFGYYAINRAPESATGVTGMFGTTACVVDYSACWGANPTVIDSDRNGVVSNRKGVKLIGIEINPSVTSSDTVLQGVSILGSTIAQPKFSAAFTVGHLNAVSPGTFRWNNAFVVSDGTSLTGYLTGAQQISGANIPGIQNLLNYRDAAGVARAVTYAASASGGMAIGSTAAANGLLLQPGLAGQAPTFRAFGSDTNVDLNLQAQGAGRVVAQVPAIFNGAATFANRLIATQPIELPVYTVANLPTCNTAARGKYAAVSDAASPAYNAALTGGGSVSVPAYCNGSAWTAH